MCASVLIYLAAADDVNTDVEQMRGSKMYMHDIQLFGGKTAVLFEEISQWLGSLWHGTRLALTVAWISVGTALVLFVLARLQDDRRD